MQIIRRSSVNVRAELNPQRPDAGVDGQIRRGRNKIPTVNIRQCFVRQVVALSVERTHDDQSEVGRIFEKCRRHRERCVSIARDANILVHFAIKRTTVVHCPSGSAEAKLTV